MARDLWDAFKIYRYAWLQGLMLTVGSMVTCYIGISQATDLDRLWETWGVFKRATFFLTILNSGVATVLGIMNTAWQRAKEEQEKKKKGY